MGLSRLFKKHKSVESLLIAAMKTVDMRDAEKEMLYFSIFTIVLTSSLISRVRHFINLTALNLIYYACTSLSISNLWQPNVGKHI